MQVRLANYGSGQRRKLALAGTRTDNAYWYFVLPALIVVAIFFVGPLGFASWLSFREFNLIRNTNTFVGLDNYARVFTDVGFLLALARTIAYVGIVTFVDFIFGFAQALLLFGLSVRFARFFRGVFLLPILLIPSASAMFWRMVMYAPPNVQILRIFGLDGVVPPLLSDPQLAFWGIILTVWWAWSPWVFLLLLGGLESLDRAPIEAARIDGAPYFRIVWHVILPLMRPVIFVTLSFKAVDSFLSFPFVWLMTQGGPGQSTHLLSTFIYEKAFHFLDYGYGSAMAITMLLISGIISIVAVIYWQRAYAVAK